MGPKMDETYWRLINENTDELQSKVIKDERLPVHVRLDRDLIPITWQRFKGLVYVEEECF